MRSSGEPRRDRARARVGRAAVSLGLVLLAATVATACSLLIDTIDLATSVDRGLPEAGADGGAEGGGDGGGTVPDGSTTDGGNVALGDGGCPTGRGPTMIAVGTYGIDSTEVTQSQYAAFLAAKAGDTSGQPSQCQWNTRCRS